MVIPYTEIVITHYGAELARRTVRPGEYLFGRGEEADFQLEIPLLSDRHAKLHLNFDEWLIEDLGSSTGTFINEQPVPAHEATRVFPTQRLRMGDAAVTLRRVRQGDAAESIAPTVATLRALLPEQIRRDQRYAVGAVVARGGMGAILQAEDQTIHRSVAMKVMLKNRGPGEVRRFVEEGQITGQLEHPNIVPVYELGVDEQDQPFYTMKFVRGTSLRKVLEGLEHLPETAKKYPLGALLTIFQKVCDALAFAHAKGVIHRDLKPDNIMLGEYGEALVMDWGLAKVLNAPLQQEGAVFSERQTAEAGLTQFGTVVGTPQYMAPEQAHGWTDQLDARTDIYALGGILYHIVTLQPPVVAGPEEGETVLDRVRSGEIAVPRLRLGKKRLPHLPEGRVPAALGAVAMKALALKPADRYATVQELQAEIAAYQNGFATQAEQAGLGRQLVLLIKRHQVLAACAALVLLLTAGFMVKVIASERRVTESLRRLVGTAPTFAAQAAALVEKGKFEPALEKIQVATSLAPAEAEYWVRQGHILESLLRLQEAASAYRQALALLPAHRVAQVHAKFCETALSQELSPGRFPARTRHELQALMRREGRLAEAIAMLGALSNDRQANYETWCAALDHAGIKQMPTQDEGGLLSLDLTRSTIDNLEPLRGMPLTHLNLTFTKVSDLSPLAGTPLSSLNLHGCSQVSDLTGLKGLKLHTLILDRTPVTDLGPLAGMPLETLQLRGAKVTVLAALHGMPLRDLVLAGSTVSDLTPLQGLPLTSLDLASTPAADLSPLHGMPLQKLVLHGTSVRNLGPLAGLPLKELRLTATPVRDLAPLANCHALEQLAIPEECKDLEPLRRLSALRKLDTEWGTGTDVAKSAATFWKEYDARRGATP